MPVSAVSYALLQETVPGAMEVGIGWWILIIALLVLTIAAMWRVFEKAGQPGWAAIIPIYNMFVLLRVAGKPMWWFLLLLIPLVNVIVWFIMYLGIARNFGKGVGFAIGLFFLGPFFFAILGFGDAQYQPTQPAM